MIRAVSFFLLGVGVTLMSAQQPSNEAAIHRGIFSALQHIKDSVETEGYRKDSIMSLNASKIIPALKEKVEDNERLRRDSIVQDARINLLEEEYSKLANKIKLK